MTQTVRSVFFLTCAALCVVSLVVLLFLPQVLSLEDDTPPPSGPIYNFEHAIFETGKRASLQGLWWFKFGTHLPPDDALDAFQNDTLQKLEVPHDWANDVPKTNTNPFADGIATYAALLNLPPLHQQQLVVALPRVHDAYRIFWVPLDAPEDSLEIGADGTMSGPIVASHGTRAYALEGVREGLLVIHVRKSLSSFGGILSAPFIAEAGSYQDRLQVRRVMEGAIMGTTLLVALFNLFLFLAYRKDPASLLLALTAAALLLRAVILSGTLEILFGGDIRPLRVRLEYSSVLILAWAAYAMHQTLIWQKFGELRGPLLFAMVGMLGVALIFVAPLPVVTADLIFLQIYCVVVIGLMLMTSARAIAQRQKDAWFYTLGWLVPLSAGIHDVHISQAYDGVYLLNLAFVIFVCVYSLKLGRRVAAGITRADIVEEERGLRAQLARRANAMEGHDPLTGLPNRAHFEDELALAWHQKDRSRDGLTLLLLEIDNYSALRDCLGANAAQSLLRQVANALRTNGLRRLDVLARINEAEFAVLLSDTNIDNARLVADRLRHGIEALSTLCDGDNLLCVTASGGLTQAKPCDTRYPTAFAMMDSARHALQQAKAAGKNRVISADNPAEPS
ncbi:diguanylate cyclase (GGDEF) domain-containing protein [Shimia marina]|uniref:diguanylate cyclase n=1 Tax=Shimia marina TaxID=321267 RepID=A0A0P1FEL0_9RHOB|nr:putative diguanylate cyclase YegE [Shimia marina]SFD75686.1 diguanylate cyclase (GGDEF) domain-containing protein [Shimia marina]